MAANKDWGNPAAEKKMFVMIFILGLLTAIVILMPAPLLNLPQWGAADAEIKVPSGENTGLKGSPFKAWSR